MQFEISKSSLVKALSNVNGVVEKRNTIPILSNIRIEAKDDKLSLMATDMDVVASVICDLFVKKEGVTTVPGQLFYDIIRKIPDGSNINIELNDKNHSLIIKYNKSKFSLPCLDPSEFPILLEGEMNVEFNITSAELIKIIDKTRFAISNDETRYYLNGLFLQSKQEGSRVELRGVATDGHRLALCLYSGLDADSKNFGVIIPRKTINEVRRIIEDDKEVKVLLSKTKIKFSCGNCAIISKLIDGEFPDYEKVLPKNNDQVINLERKSLFDAIDRVATIANDKHRSIKFILDNNKLILQVIAPDGGFADEEIEVEFSGSRIEAGFNSRYLMEIIAQIDRDYINFKFKDGSSPAIINSDDYDAIYVIMPVRI